MALQKRGSMMFGCMNHAVRVEVRVSSLKSCETRHEFWVQLNVETSPTEITDAASWLSASFSFLMVFYL